MTNAWRVLARTSVKGQLLESISSYYCAFLAPWALLPWREELRIKDVQMRGERSQSWLLPVNLSGSSFGPQILETGKNLKFERRLSKARAFIAWKSGIE